MTETSIIGDFDAALLAKEKENSCLKLITRLMHIAIPPFYLNNISKAVAIVLNKEIEYYCHELSGVPVAFNKKKVKLLSQHGGQIIPGQPKIHTDFETEFIVFSPCVGDTLKGVVHKLNMKSFGCLIHGYFYASVKYYQSDSNESISVQLGDDVVLKVIKLDEDGGGYLSIFGECVSETSSGRHLLEIDSGIDDVDRDANPPVQQQIETVKVFSDEESLSSSTSITKVSQQEHVQNTSESTAKSNDSPSFNNAEESRPITGENETFDDSSLLPEIPKESKKEKKKKKKDKKDKKKDKKEKKHKKKKDNNTDGEEKNEEPKTELEKLQQQLKEMKRLNRERKEKRRIRRLEKSGMDTILAGNDSIISLIENSTSPQPSDQMLSLEAPGTEDVVLMSDLPMITQSSVMDDLNNTDLSVDKSAEKSKKHKNDKKEKRGKSGAEKPKRKRKREPAQVAPATVTPVDSDQTTDDQPAAKHMKV